MALLSVRRVHRLACQEGDLRCETGRQDRGGQAGRGQAGRGQTRSGPAWRRRPTPADRPGNVDQGRNWGPIALFAAVFLIAAAHHIGGIQMIDGVLARCDRPEVVDLATRMKTSQEKEIVILRELLKKLHAEPL